MHPIHHTTNKIINLLHFPSLLKLIGQDILTGTCKQNSKVYDYKEKAFLTSRATAKWTQVKYFTGVRIYITHLLLRKKGHQLISPRIFWLLAAEVISTRSDKCSGTESGSHTSYDTPHHSKRGRGSSLVIDLVFTAWLFRPTPPSLLARTCSLF